MHAKDIMTAPVVTVTADAPIADIARTLFERRISAVPVVDEAFRIIGIVSEGDLMRRPESGTARRPGWWLSLFSAPESEAERYLKTHGLRARDVMTRTVVTVAEDAPLADIATLLERHRIKRVPVVRDGKPVGIVSRANLLHGLVAREKAAAPAGDDAAIRAAILDAAREAGIAPGAINVVVGGGVVHLWGAVASEAERQAVRLAAERTPGATAVENHVAIVSRDLQGLGWA